MGSLSTGLKKFLQNKNTVTIVSVVLAIFVCINTDSTGYSPLADSPLNITQSVDSLMDVATSPTSALVGIGE